MGWWLPLWVLTSVALAALAAGDEYGLVVVGVYVGANALSMAMAWFRRPPVLAGVLRGLGWAAALQLPVMVFTVLDRDGRFAAVAPPSGDSPPAAPGADHHGRPSREGRGHGSDGRAQ